MKINSENLEYINTLKINNNIDNDNYDENLGFYTSLS